MNQRRRSTVTLAVSLAVIVTLLGLALTGSAARRGAASDSPAAGWPKPAVPALAEFQRLCLDGCTALEACSLTGATQAMPGVDCAAACATSAADTTVSQPPCAEAQRIAQRYRACLAEPCFNIEACLDSVPRCQ